MKVVTNSTCCTYRILVAQTCMIELMIGATRALPENTDTAGR